jgi:hypothetical protein
VTVATARYDARVRATASLLLLAAIALLAACRSNRSAPRDTAGEPPGAPDPAVSAAARAIARNIVGPPPSSRDFDAGPLYRVNVACDPRPCTVDLADDARHPVGRWDLEHLAGLTSALRDRHVQQIALSASPEVPYADVISVMDAAREGGAADVTFVAPATVR